MGILDDAIREHLDLKRRHGASDDEVAKQEAEALGPARRQPAAEEAFDEPVDALGPPDPAAGASLAEGAPPPPPPAGFEPEPEPESDLDLEPEPDLSPEPVRDETAILDDPFLDDPVIEEPIHAEPSADDGLVPPPAAIEPEPDPAGEPDFASPPAAYRAPHEPEELDEPDEPEGLEEFDESGSAAGADPYDPPTEIARDEATRVRPTVPIHDDPLLPPEPALPRREPEPDTDPVDEIEPPPPGAGTDDVLEETPDFLQDTPEHDRLWFEQKPPRDFDFDD